MHCTVHDLAALYRTFVEMNILTHAAGLGLKSLLNVRVNHDVMGCLQ